MSTVLIVVLLCIFPYVYMRRTSKGRPPLPPGPPGDPLIGHLRMVPPENQGTLFYEWGKIYGDVLHLQILGKPIIVLNSVQAAIDLLEKRGANYSNRPRFIIYELMGWVAALPFMQYGKQFQQQQRMLYEYLTEKRCIGYQPIQTRAARILLQNLISDDDGRDNFVRRYSTAVILQITYGHKVISNADPYVKIMQDAATSMAGGGPPGSTPVDFFPFLRHLPSWFPGAYYAGHARDNKHVIDKMHTYPFETTRKKITEGSAEPSFLHNLLDTFEMEGDEKSNTLEDIKHGASTMYFGGSDTTWASLSIFILAMVLHPECQIRAQAEIDAVIGSGRLPDFGDRASLPYVDCVMQETFRWNTVNPTGVPHRSINDDVYRGMFIPKGSLVIANTRKVKTGMTLDDTLYADPGKFNPARFLPKPDGNGEPFPGGPFGFGRRLCPGRHLANASLWIAIASILATLSISKPNDDGGNEITPKIAFTSGLVSHPHPFKTVIRPRNDAARALIAQEDALDTYDL